VRARWLDHLEREYVSGLLKKHRGNMSEVARAAGLNRSYLYRLVKKHGL
jgi:transcriptional regulator of acetoin/glycerol metabolism